LNASISNITYYKTQDETTTANTTLYSAYDAGYIPSLSYGLHIGSAEPNITGSLVLGGYDKSRILSDAIVAGNDNLFRLTDLHPQELSKAFSKHPPILVTTFPSTPDLECRTCTFH
jgi:hypothetical protein